MKQISVVKTILKLAILGAAGLLVACGGSSDSDSTSDASISGTIFAAPVNGAAVSVEDVNGNPVAGPVNTNAAGEYTLTIPSGSLGQDLIVKSTGGTFTDEATGNQNVPAGEMLAYMSANSISNGSSISATPGSTIIANIVMDPNTNISLSEAEVAFDDAFGYTPDLSITPANATDPATANAAEASKLAGLRAAAFSQLNMDLGLLVAEQFDLLAALATDMADGGLDGENAGSAVEIIVGEMLPIDIENRFVTALLNFHSSGLMGDDHGTDYTGLTNDQIGVIPFSEMALTTNGKYKIVYVPGEMEAMKGRTEFSLHITNANEQNVDGLSVTLMPMMYMAGHKHSSPDIDCTGAGLGTYNCTVYYLMESVMSMDMSMGYWELMVMAEMGESAVFYPKVKMAMGDTPKVTFTAQATGTDMIAGMSGDMSRMYHVFKDSLTGMGDSRSFTVFVAAMENMMSFPALDAGTVLNSTTAYELTATPMTVEFSVDGTTWEAANNVDNGLWSSTAAITGLVDGEAGEIYVRINVANELKTTNGLAPAVVDDFDNGYSTFFVTPGGM